MDHINNQFLSLVYFFKFRGVYWYHINNQIFMFFLIFSLIWKFQTLSMICCFYFVVIWNWLVNKEFRSHREWGSHRLVLNQGDIILILNTTRFTKMESPKAYMFAADPDYKQSDINSSSLKQNIKENKHWTNRKVKETKIKQHSKST